MLACLVAYKLVLVQCYVILPTGHRKSTKIFKITFVLCLMCHISDSNLASLYARPDNKHDDVFLLIPTVLHSAPIPPFRNVSTFSLVSISHRPYVPISTPTNLYTSLMLTPPPSHSTRCTRHSKRSTPSSTTISPPTPTSSSAPQTSVSSSLPHKKTLVS